MLGLKTKDFVVINVVKHIEDLKSTDDLLYEPRALSPDELKEACNNIRLESDQVLGTVLELSVNFLIKNFFYLMHQTGLYNPQKRLWSLLAQTKKIKIKKYNKLSKKDKEHTQVFDAVLEDSFNKFAIARIVLPGSQMELPGFNDLISKHNSKCMGLFYITDQTYPEKILEKVKEKTNSQDFYDKYRSPIDDHASLNLFQYSGDDLTLTFKLIHPDLAKEVESTLCFVAS